jgi:hypothetical protein
MHRESISYPYAIWQLHVNAKPILKYVKKQIFRRKNKKKGLNNQALFGLISQQLPDDQLVASNNLFFIGYYYKVESGRLVFQ